MSEFKLIADLADGLFMDCKAYGYSKEKVLGYNILMSAFTYLQTDEPLIGNRTKTFFEGF